MKLPLIILASVFSLLGCAKIPPGIGGDSTRIVFRMTVRGQIRSDYVYVFPIRTSVDPNPVGDGPIPVLQFPATNGFVAGNVQYFVLWTPDTQQYTLYKFTDSSLTFYNAVGTPLNPIDVTQGSRTLGFELSLTQLVDAGVDPNTLNVLQVNFLTMNKKLDQSNGSTRLIDCLGNTNLQTDFNEPVKIPLTTTGTYDNARFNFLEPLDPDCPDPDLDISDWSVQVNRQ